jgi:hypothetical protein
MSDPLNIRGSIGHWPRSPFFWAVLVTAALGTLFAFHDPDPDRVDEVLPRFQVAGLDGTRIDSSTLVGKPWVIALWMPGCSACKADMTALEETRRVYEARGVGFLAASIVEDPGSVRAAASELGFEGELVMSVGDLMHDLKVTGVPSSVFVNARGHLVARVASGRRSARFFSARAEELLKGAPDIAAKGLASVTGDLR